MFSVFCFVSSPDGMKKLFQNLKMDQLLPQFSKNQIRCEDLVLLTEDDLKSLIQCIGPRRRLQRFIEEFKK